MWVARHCFVGATYASFRAGGVKSPVDDFSIRQPEGDGWYDNSRARPTYGGPQWTRAGLVDLGSRSYVMGPDISQLQFSMTELT